MFWFFQIEISCFLTHSICPISDAQHSSITLFPTELICSKLKEDNSKPPEMEPFSSGTPCFQCVMALGRVKTLGRKGALSTFATHKWSWSWNVCGKYLYHGNFESSNIAHFFICSFFHWKEFLIQHYYGRTRTSY